MTYSPAVPAENPELVAARARGASGSRHAPRCWPPSAPPGAAWRWPGPTARRRRRRCCRSSSSRRACARPSSSAPTSTRSGPTPSGTTGEWLVVEADESYGTFQALRPDLAVLTNVEPDHLDHYGTFAACATAFERVRGLGRRGRGRVRRRPRGRGHRAGARVRSASARPTGSTYTMSDLELQPQLGVLHAARARR